MKTVNYITREYVNPIDLNVLGNTYNTLEQGHKEAVKAASDLEITMANLDLNENEAEWRQNKINEIKQTVIDNTIYGNAYGALDDIITKAGNIASDQGMIGRLQAQKDYKTFKDELNKRSDLSEDYKEMYREINPYKYEDKIDEETGKIISGTKWEPSNNPTKVIPLNEIITQGLHWAAKESGGGDTTFFLDSNGNPTTNPSASEDGQMYIQKSGKFEKLTKDKILKGIQSAIATIPGAKESIEQDYNVSEWKHNKEIKNNNGKIVIDDITDKNGILLTPEQYLSKRIDPAVQAASYYNSTTTTNYGNALATYKARQMQSEMISKTDTIKMEQASISGRNTPIEVPVDMASKYVATKNIAANGIQNIYKQLTGKDLYMTNDQIGNMEQLLNKYNIPVNDRQQLRSLVKTYNESIKNMQLYTATMNDSDKRDFEFAARMKSGGELINGVNGGSKYDDEAIKSINKIYGKGTKLEVTFDNDEIKSTFENIINGNQINGYKNLGIIIQGNKLIIPKDKMYSLPIIMDALEKTKEKANTGFFESIGGRIFDRYHIRSLDDNNQSVGLHRTTGGDLFRGSTPVAEFEGRKLAKLYNSSTKIGDNISNKYNIASTTVTLGSLNLDGKSFTEGTLLNQYNNGILSKEQYEIQKKYYNDSFDDILSNTDFSQTDMYYLEENDNVKRRITNSADRFNYGSEILRAIKDKRVTVNPSVVPGISDPISGAPISGYNITVIPEKDAPKDAQPKRFYIPGLVNETASKYMMQDPYVQAFSTISILGATKSTRSITDSNVNPKLGNINLTGLGNNNYAINFNGINKVINQEDAMKFTTAFNNYNAVKNIVLSENTGELNQNMRSTLVNSAKIIGNLTGTNPEAVLEKLLDDINK